ncbi:MAG: restriction endonuclease subunit S [Opitutaceae bacterium]|nr:restriction endonuclease subunit S [Opitutaceae bacterium]
MLKVLSRANTSVVKLADVAELNPRLREKPALDTKVSFVPMAAVSSEAGTVVREEIRPYRDVAKGFTAFENGDVLVAKITPCFENNKIAQASLSLPIGFGSTEFHVVRARRGESDARYLFHFLRQDHVRSEGERKMTGSAGQRRVPEHFLADLDIFLPPLPEQRQIAAILDQADALRVKRREALAKLDEIAQAIFVEMLGDPVTNSLGWDDSQVLGDVADVASGITKGRKVGGETLRTVPYLAVSNVQDQRLDLTVVKTIEATEREIERYKLMKDDLVITEGGDPDKLGRGVLWNVELAECIHQNHIFRIRLSSDDLHPVFLAWLVGSQRGKQYFFRAAKQTTGIASINMTQLRAFPLLVPPMPIQKRFISAIEQVDLQRQRLREASAEHEGLFASLQHRAFSGTP